MATGFSSAHNLGMSEDTRPKFLTVSPRDFFEKVAPESTVIVEHATRRNVDHLYFDLPEIELHCDIQKCSGVRIYRSDDEVLLDRTKRIDDFAVYFCKNCGEMTKTYAFSSWFIGNDFQNVCCFKYGEYPRFGEEQCCTERVHA
jgi:hypothetical protein